ncbi:type II secretion system protein [Ideonella sp.]|jgi:prepilin-type N-terminal cleavage/methylation domain-containing protein|uniref:type II secretion system protein n=1 Tax=Ideonella sp. TaxID=1929293 RepID=UPI0037C0455F
MKSFRSPARRLGFKRSNAQGFTLLELITVVVILGSLAAVAMPKFMDLKGSAQVAVFQGGLADARSKMLSVYGMAALLGPGGTRTSHGCTSSLDANGNGTICLQNLPVHTVAYNMSCHTGMGQATMFKGPYTAGQNATTTYHTLGDTAGGANYWTHTASGCTFTCTAGNGLNQMSQITVTSSTCL